MKTQMVDRTQEKIVLAKEIGMHDWAAIQELTALKFRPIDDERLRKMLNDGKRIWDWKYIKLHPETILLTVLSALIGFAISLVVCIATNLSPAKAPSLVYAIVGVSVVSMFLLTLFISGFRHISISKMKLADWVDPIPYGAMLAVKEAQAKGLTNFRIFYPLALEERVYQDPIIVGTVGNDKHFEVFAWDDGKVYE